MRALRLVAPEDGDVEASAFIAFCSHCASRQTGPDPWARVCSACGLGVIVQAAEDVAPSPAEPFIVVAPDLTVGGMSEQAEQALGVAEPEVVRRPLSELLAEGGVEGRFSTVAWAIAAAVHGSPTPRHIQVKAKGSFGLRWRARIGPCGPPVAALVVLET